MLSAGMQRHLIPGVLAEHGLSPHQLIFPADAISLIADGYTPQVSSIWPDCLWLRPICRQPSDAACLMRCCCLYKLPAKCTCKLPAAPTCIVLLRQSKPLGYSVPVGKRLDACMQAGVRSLSRNLAAICRHVAVQIVSEQDSLNKQENAGSSSDPDDNTHELPDAHDQPEAAGSSHQLHPHSHVTADHNPAQRQQHQPSNSSAIQQDLESPTTATSGGFFWGSLWGGLKGAFTPPRQHPSSRRHHPHLSSASRQQPHAAQHAHHSHAHAANAQTAHAGSEYATTNAHQQQAQS